MKIKYCFYIVSIFLLISCATNRSIVDTNITSIEFGYSGGFSNQHTKKILDYKGHLYKVSDNKKVLLCKLDDEIVHDLFVEASVLDKPIRDSGNMSYYIVIKKKSGDLKWVWNKSTENVDLIWSLYSKLNDLK